MSFAPYTSRSVAESLRAVDGAMCGLSAPEAARRLAEHGPNVLSRQSVRWWRVLLRQFASPFLYLLAAAALLAACLGQPVDALMITAFVLMNAGLGFGQEYHSERAVELLRSFVTARARVRRDGAYAAVDSRELVVGDVVVVETGDVVQADVRFLETEGLSVDESALTGESVPAKKYANALAVETSEAYQAENIGFAGTTVVSGRGVGVVIATAASTQMGEVGTLAGAANEPSAFEKGIGRFSMFILKTIVVTLMVVFAANVAIKGAGVDIPELLIFSIALAVSVIPEALPLVITTTLSRGALRLARANVVVKRLSAIEDLGSIQVLCTDKTGTITENKMEVAQVTSADPDRCLYLAAAASSFLGDRQAQPNNAFDLAVWNRLDAPARARVMAEPRSHEVPFDPVRRWNSVMVGDQLVVRGAVEEVTQMTGAVPGVDAWARAQGIEGRRVLAVASGKSEKTLAFVGAISFEDPVKDGATDAVAQAKQLGVQVKILTGDSREVAVSVATRIGLIVSDAEAMTGEEWEALSDEARLAAAQSHAVFARVSPQQKYRLIQTLRATQEVGFLGEGINDAPALKMASVGIVVDGASDIARESADIVLLRHSLDVIIGGIREGREVFANTVKYIKATLASNFGNFLAVAVATLLVDYLPMLPIQILLVNLLSDFPMIAIATDRVDADELASPRSYDLKDIVYAATVIGLVSTVFDFIFFALFSRVSPEVLHTNWFIGSILTELVLIFSIRTRKPFWKGTRPSGVLFWLSASAFAATLIIPFTNLGDRVFRLMTPSRNDLLLILGIVVLYFIVTETVKLAYERSKNGLARSPGRR